MTPKIEKEINTPRTSLVSNLQTESRGSRLVRHYRRHNFTFVPIAVEIFGVLGDAANDFMYELGKRISAVSREPRSRTFLMQRLSVAIQRGNAASVLGTVNSSVDLDAVFYL